MNKGIEKLVFVLIFSEKSDFFFFLISVNEYYLRF